MKRFEIIVILFLLLIACVVFAAVGVAIFFVYSSPQAASPVATLAPTLAPSPKPTYVSYEFTGEGDKVEVIQVYADAPTFINTVHRAERPTQLFTVNIKDASGKIVSFAIAAQGDAESEKVLNLPPGQYFVEIHGASWIVVISPGQ